MLQNLAFLDAWSVAEALLRWPSLPTISYWSSVHFCLVYHLSDACFPCHRFMWRPIHSPVLGAIHLIHVLLPSQMQITLLSSLQAPLLGWTSFKGMKAMVSLCSPLSAISAWKVRTLSLAPQMVLMSAITSVLFKPKKRTCRMWIALCSSIYGALDFCVCVSVYIYKPSSTELIVLTLKI